MHFSPATYLKKLIRAQLLLLIKKIARSDFVQSLVWGRNETQSLVLLDTFTDSKGNDFQRLKGWRESIVPRYTQALKPQSDTPQVKAEEINNARNAVRSMENFLQICGYSIRNMKILELGCHGGAHACAMVELGAMHVEGIDIPQYGIRQSLGKKENKENVEQQSKWLNQLRVRTIDQYEGKYLCKVREKVNFFDLDVLNLEKSESYDAVISWQTLEHITQPQIAFKNIFRSLRPGGIGFHVYNPYFCIDGGHSLCTLDFPYGHARLTDIDFERYIKIYRPEEFEVAKNFFYHSLNRMTLADLKAYTESAGFEILELIPWHSKHDLGSVNQTVLIQIRELYPNVTLNDLLSRSVWIFFKKPSPVSIN